MLCKVIVMSCPFYEDYTRGCAEKFMVILNFITFDICESQDDYKNCILYKAIIENKPICPGIYECTEHFQKLTIKVILKLMKSDKIYLDRFLINALFESFRAHSASLRVNSAKRSRDTG